MCHLWPYAILVACQLISAAGAIVLVTRGGIIGSELTDNQALATLPVSVMVLSLAATTIPAIFLMRAIGRKLGYALASLSAAVSASLTARLRNLGVELSPVDRCGRDLRHQHGVRAAIPLRSG